MNFQHLLNGALNDISVRTINGVVEAVEGGHVEAAGLGDLAKVGDRLIILGERPTYAEVVAIRDDIVLALPDSNLTGMSPGDPVHLLEQNEFRPSPEWLGHVIDARGEIADGRQTPLGDSPMPLYGGTISVVDRRGLGARIKTGLAPFDTFLPLCRGQRLGLFAGSGVGKTSLLRDLAAGVDADVVIIALIGERSREVREFVRDVLSASGRDHYVVFVSTCDEPAPSKRRCAHMAMSTAEYFRDQGLHVLLLFDSVTRYVDAHREIALSGGETPSLRAYPPSTFGAFARLAERAGPGAGAAGDITAIFTVLVAGSDMDEPIADMVRSILDGHVVLDRAIAERGRFPAINIRRSVSRSLPKAATPEENAVLNDARRLLAAYDDASVMIKAGLYAKGSDPETDRAISVWPALDAFVSEKSESCEESFSKLRKAIGA